MINILQMITLELFWWKNMNPRIISMQTTWRLKVVTIICLGEYIRNLNNNQLFLFKNDKWTVLYIFFRIAGCKWRHCIHCVSRYCFFFPLCALFNFIPNCNEHRTFTIQTKHCYILSENLVVITNVFRHGIKRVILVIL